MNRDDIANMNGKLVAEHLMAAGRAWKNGEKYEFPGGPRFPLQNFE